MKLNYLVAIMAAGFMLHACGSKENITEEEVKFIATCPLQKDTTIIKDYVCQIRAIQHIELRALERGYLQQIFVDEGQLVKKGQLMFQIMPTILSAEVHKAQAEVDFAAIEYKNTKALADSNVVSRNELALSKANLEKARAQLELAQAHLGFSSVKAPFSGIMDRFNVRLGSLVEEGELLTSLSDNSSMWVYFNVPESEYLEYKQRHKLGTESSVQLKMANNELFYHSGKIETIEADFNNETGNISFRAKFPNPEGLLRHGETGNIEMTVPLKNAIIIPQKATFEVLEKKYVFVIDNRNVVHQREVRIVAEMPDLFVVNGLKPTERIVLEGIRKVSEGQRIDYSYQDPKKVINNLKVYVE